MDGRKMMSCKKKTESLHKYSLIYDCLRIVDAQSNLTFSITTAENLFQFSQGDINECRSRSGSNSQRRGSNYEGSASKVDLLRSALEISSQHSKRQNNVSNPVLNCNRNSQAYKVSQRKPVKPVLL